MGNIQRPSANLNGNTGPISKFLLLELPIHSNINPTKGTVSPFAIAMHQALMILAQQQWRDSLHVEAKVKGKINGERQVSNEEQFKDNRRRGYKVPMHYAFEAQGDEFVIGTRKRIRRAYKSGYNEARGKLQKQGPDDDVTLVITRPQLLRMVKLSDQKTNRLKVMPALKELTASINNHPIFIFKVTELDGSRVKVTINSEYLCGKVIPYANVPMPLPLRHPGVLRGWLLFHGYRKTDDEWHKRKYTPFDALFQKLDIDRRYGNPRAQDRFDTNLKAINRLLMEHGFNYRFVMSLQESGTAVRIIREEIKPTVKKEVIKPAKPEEIKVPENLIVTKSDENLMSEIEERDRQRKEHEKGLARAAAMQRFLNNERGHEPDLGGGSLGDMIRNGGFKDDYTI